MLDNKLIILSNDILPNRWSYLTQEDPRGSLLANRWNPTAVQSSDAPKEHTAFVFRNKLVLLGGERKTLGTLENGRCDNAHCGGQ